MIDINRDRYGRPLIIPPGGGKPAAYTRCTTYIKTIDDTHHLTQWQLRMAAYGVAATPHLPTLIKRCGPEPDDPDAKKQWRATMAGHVETALETAGAHDKARRGTAFHQATETVDLGGAPDNEWATQIDIYRQATRHLKPVAVEQFLVCDELQVAGTADRIYRVPGVAGTIIGDLKTGNITYAASSIAMQLAIYAHSEMYDPATGHRTPVPELRTDIGIIIDHDLHAGTCQLHQIDLVGAWDAVMLARDVRAWRKTGTATKLLTPFLPPVDAVDAAITVAIGQATSRDDLAALWKEAAASGAWTEAHTTAAQTRLAHLNNI